MGIPTPAFPHAEFHDPGSNPSSDPHYLCHLANALFPGTCCLCPYRQEGWEPVSLESSIVTIKHKQEQADMWTGAWLLGVLTRGHQPICPGGLASLSTY